MGCDIHIVLERRRKEVGARWIGIDTFRAYHRSVHDIEREKDKNPGMWTSPNYYHHCKSRNYMRFAWLAGVRGAGPPPAGIPDDISELAADEIDGWNGDGHSHSWLSLEDAIEVFLATEIDPHNVFFREGDPRKEDPGYYFFGVYADQRENYDYRIVFWFDN